MENDIKRIFRSFFAMIVFLAIVVVSDKYFSCSMF